MCKCLKNKELGDLSQTKCIHTYCISVHLLTLRNFYWLPNVFVSNLKVIYIVYIVWCKSVAILANKCMHDFV